ncbi:TPA: hypothetical protein DCX15_00950 [bacterium]|nr:hypothetical protein [bacterium]
MRFTTIKDFRRVPRFPVLGIIKLGKKATNQKGKALEEVNYFIVPPEIETVYGDRPTRLDILFPSEVRQVVIPMSYKRFAMTKTGKARMMCFGDGQESLRYDKESNSLKEGTCPCEEEVSGKCRISATLNIILPKVSVGGVYQINTASSWNINRTLDYMEYLQAIADGCTDIPVILERTPMELPSRQGGLQTHHLFRFNCALTLDQLMKVRERRRGRGLNQIEHRQEDIIPIPAIKDERNQVKPYLIESTQATQTIQSTQVDQVDQAIPEQEKKDPLLVQINALRKKLQKMSEDYPDTWFVNYLGLNYGVENTRSLTGDQKRNFIQFLSGELDAQTKLTFKKEVTDSLPQDLSEIEDEEENDFPPLEE